MAENDVVGGAVLFFELKADCEASSPVPHLATP